MNTVSDDEDVAETVDDEQYESDSDYSEESYIYEESEEQFDKDHKCKSLDICMSKLVLGSFLRVTQKCNSCNKETQLDSQPFVRNIPEELTHNVVVDIQLVQSNVVKNSNHMELEGLKRAVNKIQDFDITIDALFTDRHQQVSKWLRETQANIKHYDVWQLAKGIKKKVLALAKREECEIIGEWSKSIVNHLYWCAASSDDNEEMIKDKWLSLINHIHNKHQHSGLFKKCAHGRVDHNKK
uniref:Uncharacterized protein n=1 Tax=Amphimedon queenslandica TaxID=400682 RepID=A0A1X7VJG1_AMPQE